ncbi:MAG: hypothetical protein JW803_03000 [Endomicrobiales bacterium]|nr:hypothetical protein [Endomicrobiales bacterium]
MVTLLFFIPIFAVIAISFINGERIKTIKTISVLTACAELIVSVRVFTRVLSGTPVVKIAHNVLGLNDYYFMADGLSILFVLVVNSLLLLVTVFSLEYIKRRGIGVKQYFMFLFAVFAGINGTLISGDLIGIFIFVELASISSYILTAMDRKDENYEAAIKYIVFGTISSLLLLLSMAFIYSKISSLSLADISGLWTIYRNVGNMATLVVLISALCIKSAIVPFHFWAPDAYVSAPSPISAVFSGAINKGLGVYLLMRFSANILAFDRVIMQLLAFLGVVSIVIGVVLAIYQWNYKRLLAYHSISQLGYIFLGFSAANPVGILGALFHLVNHSIFKPLLFLTAGSIETSTGKSDLKEMGGLSKKLPVTSFSSMIASLSISGVPPFNGFWSKLLIIIACVRAEMYVYALIAAAGSILTLSSFLKVQRYAFYGFLKDENKNVTESPLSMTVPMIILAFLCVFLGILLLPGIDRSFLGLALDVIMSGKEGYCNAVSEGMLK